MTQFIDTLDREEIVLQYKSKPPLLVADLLESCGWMYPDHIDKTTGEINTTTLGEAVADYHDCYSLTFDIPEIVFDCAFAIAELYEEAQS